MIEWLLAFTAGLLGSSHCLGMCGPFALSLGSSAPNLMRNFQRQLSYSCGRIFTYAVLGAVAGYGGKQLLVRYSGLAYVPALLAALSGSLLVYQGFLGAGILRRRARKGAALPCLAAPGFASLLTLPGCAVPFLAGILTGLLPCGLLYGMVVLAAQSGAVIPGALLMALFGAGTVPLMASAGWGGTLLDISMRRKLYRVAAWCVVLTGAVTLVRGATFLYPRTESLEKSCPFCLPQ